MKKRHKFLFNYRIFEIKKMPENAIKNAIKLQFYIIQKNHKKTKKNMQCSLVTRRVQFLKFSKALWE